jgi:hypothetical protein
MRTHGARRALLIALAVLTAGVGSAFADSSADSGAHYYRQVRGKKGRKYIRHFLLRKNLTGDKKLIYETYGWTPHRLRIDFAGRVTERWIYYTEGRYFEFDDEGNLIEERAIAREEGHIE